MSSLIFVFMMQYVISTKAGLVNHVQGEVNVAVADSVAVGAPIKTGPDSFAEILLNPGSFLRIGGNSEVILENIDLSKIALRIVSGSAVVEASEVDKQFPIKISTGGLSVLIVDSGIFKFEDGKATVIAGTLETADSRIPFRKGFTLFSRDNVYRSIKVARNEPPTLLESWSEARSTLMLVANAQTFNTFRRIGMPSYPSSWMWVPSYGAWTYFPYARTRSPYGNVYRSYTDFQPGVAARGGDESGVNDASRPSGGSGGFGNSGGSGAGGYSPANDRPTYREAVPMKNAPVPGGPGGPGGSN